MRPKYKTGYKAGHNVAMRIVRITAYTLIIAPLMLIVAWSFANRWAWPDLLPEGISYRGMEELFVARTDMTSILVSSVALSAIAALFSAIIALMAARAIAIYIFPGKKLVLFGVVLPVIVPGTVFAMGIHILFIRMGLSDTAAGVIITHIICALPYTVYILTDVTTYFGDKLEIQAQTLGCAPARAFFIVTAPLLMPGILSAASMAYIISFSQYFLTLLIGGGKVKTLSIVMVPFISGGDRTLASAYALLFVISIAAVLIIFEFFVKFFHASVGEQD